MGLEETKGICLDRGLWRSKVDGVPDGLCACIKCGRRHNLMRCKGIQGASSVTLPKRMETCWRGLGATYL